MSKTILFFTVLFSFSVWGQGFNGGQTGNGGNGCWFSDSNRALAWKTIEELRYWHIISPDLWGGFGQYRTEKNDKLRVRANYFYYDVDMSKFKAYKLARKRLSQLKFNFPKVLHALEGNLYLFKSVRVLQYELKGIFEGDLSQLRFPCQKFSPAILTLEDRTVLLVRPVWNEINLFTAEVVMVHEILRFAQMLNPVFSKFSNDELQELTAILFARHRNFSAQIQSILGPIENSL